VTFKPSDALRFLGGLGIAALVLAFVALRVTSCAPAPPAHLPAQTGPVSPSLPPFPSSPSPPPTLPPASSAACEDGPAAAARANAASLGSLAWSPFGRAEAGWETYAPLIAREIATACGPATPGFAAALAAWQDRQRLAADGIMSAAVFARLKGIVQMRRPFVRLSAQGACPAPPAESTLAWARPAEGYSNKPLQLRPGALAAYREDRRRPPEPDHLLRLPQPGRRRRPLRHRAQLQRHSQGHLLGPSHRPGDGPLRRPGARLWPRLQRRP
jgi:D-alanyl-D-alanine carboxypeptidase